jgi:hypothetical protein
MIAFAASDFATPVWPKACTCCGAEYGAAAWAALPMLGRIGDDLDAIEMKNCALCGGTMAIAAPLEVQS